MRAEKAYAVFSFILQLAFGEPIGEYHMSRRQFLLSLLLVFSMVFVTSALQADDSMQVSPSNARVLSPEEALRRDAEWYADAHGVSLDEALRRLHLEHEASMLAVQLAANESDTYAGVWISHEPEFVVSVAFTENGAATIAPYVQNTPLVSVIRLQAAPYTLVELQNWDA